MAVFAWGFDGIDRDIRKAAFFGGRHNPLNIVVVAACPRHVHQQRLVGIPVHQRLRRRARQSAEVHGRAQGRHRTAQIQREAHLTNPQSGRGDRHPRLSAFCPLVAHNRIRADRVEQVELHLVPHMLVQVLAAHNRQMLTGLFAQGFFRPRRAFRHLTGQAVKRRVTLHVHGKQPRRLLYHVGFVAVRRMSFSHLSNLRLTTV